MTVDWSLVALWLETPLSSLSTPDMCVRVPLLQVGKAAAFVIGITFITAQTLTSLGYVDVNWKKARCVVAAIIIISNAWKRDTESLNASELTPRSIQRLPPPPKKTAGAADHGAAGQGR